MLFYMRFLGIDFGTRKIGLAISDEEGNMAFPYSVVLVDQHLLDTVATIIQKENIGGVVIGESRNFKGEENPLMQKVHTFKAEIEKELSIPIYFEPEVLSSQEAKRIQGNVKKLDASAATIILQSFLDKQHNA